MKLCRNFTKLHVAFNRCSVVCTLRNAAVLSGESAVIPCMAGEGDTGEEF